MAGISIEYHTILSPSKSHDEPAKSSGHAPSLLTVTVSNTQSSVKVIISASAHPSLSGVPVLSSVTVMVKSPSFITGEPTAMVSTVPGSTHSNSTGTPSVLQGSPIVIGLSSEYSVPLQSVHIPSDISVVASPVVPVLPATTILKSVLIADCTVYV